ncbi:hypothetical protein PMKS-001498 [Pichia membranifaciens]|uniref:Signal recognition particle subunit SRP72 n=1 Tax=Pichia membranifaciens TaxID=4926 RepID=A0A1Q2YEP8_9ASCO|nr:hypothetical protein PMKS-001498 [Pichia membranifaciens]
MSALTDLFGKLEVYSKTDSHRQVYDTAKLILQKDKTNVSALKRSLVALINMDNYTDAKKLLQQHKSLVDSNKAALVLELAYIHYKLDSKEEELLQLADSTSQSTLRGFNHILAQYYYRTGDDVKALELYKMLIKEDGSDSLESLDLTVNERAVISQLKFQSRFPYTFDSQTVPISTSHPDSYDELFNDSLILIIDGKYKDALASLNKTYDLAESSLADYEPQEKFNELAPIKLQKAYLYILMAKYGEANVLLDELNEQLKSIDSAGDVNAKILKLLVQNNKLVCIQNLESLDGVEPTLLYRELDLQDTISLSKPRLTLPQLSIIERNHLLLSFLSGKQSKKSIKHYSEDFPSSLLPEALNSGITKEDLISSNKKLFYNLSTKRPSNLSLALLSAQVAIKSSNYQRAISLIENVVNHDEKTLLLPSVGKLLYSLYEALDCKKLIHQLFLKIQKMLMEKQNETFSNEDIKYAKFVSLKLLATDEFIARKLLEKINELDILNAKYSSADIQSLVAGVDIDVLVSQGITSLIKSSISSSTQSNSSKLSKVSKPKRKRSKPKKLARDTVQQIDSERWLPMKDRTYFKMKKSKKLKNTQGGVIDAATEKALNISGLPSTAAAETKISTTSGKSSASKKSKKKKGKK